MTKRLSIELPDALRQEILDCKAWMQGQLDTRGKEYGGQSGKIRELEGIITELESRASSLHPEIVTSDKAASELLIVESRLTAARSALEGLQSKTANPVPLDLMPAHHVLLRILHHWREQLPLYIRGRMAPFNIPEHLLLPLAAHSHAMRILGTLRDYPPQFPWQINEVFDRALRRQVDLGIDEPAESAAPAAQPDSTTPPAQPS